MGDRGREPFPKHQPCPVDSVSDGIARQVARAGNLVVAKAGYLSQQEDVTVHMRQGCESLIDRGCRFLGRRCGKVAGVNGRRARVPVESALVVQHDISCDAKQPRSQIGVCACRHRCPADSEEYLLGQLVCRVEVSGSPIQVPEHPVAIQPEERFGVGHWRHHQRTPQADQALSDKQPACWRGRD